MFFSRPSLPVLFNSRPVFSSVCPCQPYSLFIIAPHNHVAALVENLAASSSVSGHRRRLSSGRSQKCMNVLSPVQRLSLSPPSTVSCCKVGVSLPLVPHTHTLSPPEMLAVVCTIAFILSLCVKVCIAPCMWMTGFHPLIPIVKAPSSMQASVIRQIP